MTDQRISVHDRVAVLDALDHLGREANKAAAWLSERGFESEADLAQDAARSIMAAVGLLSRPLRQPPPPERWQQPQQAANGYRGG